MNVTRAKLDSYRNSVNAQAAAARAEVSAMLDAMLKTNKGHEPRVIRDYALQVIRDVMSVYGRNAGELADSLFEDMTGETARLYDGIDWDMVIDKVRYLTSMIVAGDAEGFKSGLVDAANFYVKRNNYENTVRNCRDKGIRYARVPTGRETCAFCFMLSSRGFVYYSEMTAMGEHGYHVNCDCIAVPGDENTVVEGYDWRGMYERYKQCCETANVSPYATGREYRNAVMREINTRDYEWLYTGKAPEVKYETERVKYNATVRNPHEQRTAERLARLGIEPYFIQDYKMVVGEDGIKRKVGMPDFRNGVEIKTPLTSKNARGAVRNYLDNSAKKQGVKRVIIDNTESLFTDEQLISAVSELLPEYSLKVAVLGKNGRLIDIK